jgi:hypothetical protein
MQPSAFGCRIREDRRGREPARLSAAAVSRKEVVVPSQDNQTTTAHAAGGFPLRL